jgi:hypothetical protein
MNPVFDASDAASRFLLQIADHPAWSTLVGVTEKNTFAQDIDHATLRFRTTRCAAEAQTCTVESDSIGHQDGLEVADSRVARIVSL